MRCTTRAKKNVVMQQQMINVDEAVQILEQETPPLVVNRNKLKVCWMTAELIFATELQASLTTLLPSFLTSLGAAGASGEKD